MNFPQASNVIIYWTPISSLICFWVTWDHESIYERDLVQHLWDWILPVDMQYKCIMYISSQDAAENGIFVLILFCYRTFIQSSTKAKISQTKGALKMKRNFLSSLCFIFRTPEDLRRGSCLPYHNGSQQQKIFSSVETFRRYFLVAYFEQKVLF